ncbi:MAG: sulfatase [Acidobacteriota bacterium]
MNQEPVATPRRGLAAGRLLAACLLLGCLGLAACTGPGADETEIRVIDLVDIMPSATVHRPTERLLTGSPETWGALLAGFHDRATDAADDPQGRVSTWTVGDRSEVELFIAAPRDTELVLEIAPLLPRLAPDPKLRLELNGEPLAEHPLEQGGWQVLRVPVPSTMQRHGVNRLTIHNPPHGDPTPDPRKDVRILWRRIALDPAPSQVREPVTRADTGTLFLPYGSKVELLLELPPHSELVAADVRVRGGDGALDVVWRDAADPSATREADWVVASSIGLTESHGASGRLSLFARAAETAAIGSDAGIYLVDPHIVRPATVTADSTDASAEEGPAATASSEPASSAAGSTADGSAFRPNLLVYLVDTLRADHLSTYGYDRPTAPRLDELAAEGIVFLNAQAQSPWTRASVASIFTGLWPSVHGAVGDPDVLSDEVSTVAELLREAGYTTLGFTGNGNSNAAFGFSQGFDDFVYLEQPRPTERLARASDINEHVFARLEQLEESQPFFLWVHTIDPHAPYDPAEPFRSQFAPAVTDPEIGSMEHLQSMQRSKVRVDDAVVQQMVDLYDAEIAENDAAFGALLDELKRRDLYDQTMILFISDHGEEFYEHGRWAHGKTLYTEMLDVPLVVKMPGGHGAGTRIDAVVQHVDLPYTLLEAAGLASTLEGQGRSLLPLLQGEEVDDWPNRAIAEVDLRGYVGASWIGPEWKMIRFETDGVPRAPRLFDRTADRVEQNDLGRDREVMAEVLASRVAAETAAAAQGRIEAGVVDPAEQAELEAALRALGYIQ